MIDMTNGDYPLIDAVIATAVLVILLWFVRIARLWILRRLEGLASYAEQFSGAASADLKVHILRAVQTLVRLLAFAAIGLIIYLWVVHALSLFPATAPWGEQLGQFLIDLFRNFGMRALGALPGLFTVLIIIVIARWCVRLINVFSEKSRREDSVSAGWNRKPLAPRGRC
jgi:hypothetical protein